MFKITQVTVIAENRNHVKLPVLCCIYWTTLLTLLFQGDRKCLGNSVLLLWTVPSIVHPLADISQRGQFSAQLTPSMDLSQWLTIFSSLQTPKNFLLYLQTLNCNCKPINCWLGFLSYFSQPSTTANWKPSNSSPKTTL